MNNEIGYLAEDISKEVLKVQLASPDCLKHKRQLTWRQFLNQREAGHKDLESFQSVHIIKNENIGKEHRGCGQRPFDVEFSYPSQQNPGPIPQEYKLMTPKMIQRSSRLPPFPQAQSARARIEQIEGEPWVCAGPHIPGCAPQLWCRALQLPLVQHRFLSFAYEECLLIAKILGFKSHPELCWSQHAPTDQIGMNMPFQNSFGLTLLTSKRPQICIYSMETGKPYKLGVFFLT